MGTTPPATPLPPAPLYVCGFVTTLPLLFAPLPGPTSPIPNPQGGGTFGFVGGLVHRYRQDMREVGVKRGKKRGEREPVREGGPWVMELRAQRMREAQAVKVPCIVHPASCISLLPECAGYRQDAQKVGRGAGGAWKNIKCW